MGSAVSGLILVADDNESARYHKVRTLRRAGYEVIEAASGEEAAIRDAHAAWCIEIAERSWHMWIAAGWGGDWLPQLTAELGNLRAALEWLADAADPTRLVRLAGALDAYWHLGGARLEGRLWLERALDRRPLVAGSSRARALIGAAMRLF